MNSHSSLLKNGLVSRIMEVSRDECRVIHARGTYSAFGKTWSRIRPNSTTTMQVTFSGTVTHEGSCEGGYFSDGVNAWDKALVEGSISISIVDYYATLRFDKKEVRLQNGFSCGMDTSKCIDPDNGYTFWDVFTDDECDSRSFHVLYRGQAKRAKVYDRKNPQLITYIYSVSTENSLFTLS
ncbi:unnamed protein product [Parnassius apollo]|uniref:(apollo) hypothetical protein n=1 Tax=Parnassius apollo TaxID=110799 RepID=A0A8S3W382_PARAO|nr:unnamed protein product [Parnassius apollo]